MVHVRCLVLLVLCATQSQSGKVIRVTTTGDQSKSVYLNDKGVEVIGQKTLIMDIKACAEAVIQFAQTQTLNGGFFEVYLGSRDNSMSMIRFSGKKKKESVRGSPLDCKAFKTFWFSWEDEGTLRVGSGSIIGVREFLSLEIEERIEIHYVIVYTSLGNDGEWKVLKDARPEFVHPNRDGSTVIEVREDTPAHADIYELKAHDPDEDDVTYHVIGQHDDMFGVSGTHLKILKRLDYETKQNFVVTISASDGKHEVRQSMMVMVVDLVDEIPVIGPPIMSTILEELPIGTPIGQLATVVDRDRGAKLKYSLRGPDSHYFNMDPNTGEVRMRKRLDRDRRNGRHVLDQLILTVDDHIHLQEKKLRIGVLDINDNPPMFGKSIYRVAVKENMLKDTVIANLSCVDIDDGANSIFTLVVSSVDIHKVPVKQATKKDVKKDQTWTPDTGRVSSSVTPPDRSTDVSTPVRNTDSEDLLTGPVTGQLDERRETRGNDRRDKDNDNGEDIIGDMMDDLFDNDDSGRSKGKRRPSSGSNFPDTDDRKDAFHKEGNPHINSQDTVGRNVRSTNYQHSRTKGYPYSDSYHYDNKRDTNYQYQSPNRYDTKRREHSSPHSSYDSRYRDTLSGRKERSRNNHNDWNENNKDRYAHQSDGFAKDPRKSSTSDLRNSDNPLERKDRRRYGSNERDRHRLPDQSDAFAKDSRKYTTNDRNYRYDRHWNGRTRTSMDRGSQNQERPATKGDGNRRRRPYRRDRYDDYSDYDYDYGQYQRPFMQRRHNYRRNRQRGGAVSGSTWMYDQGYGYRRRPKKVTVPDNWGDLLENNEPYLGPRHEEPPKQLDDILQPVEPSEGLLDIFQTTPKPEAPPRDEDEPQKHMQNIITKADQEKIQQQLMTSTKRVVDTPLEITTSQMKSSTVDSGLFSGNQAASMGDYDSQFSNMNKELGQLENMTEDNSNQLDGLFGESGNQKDHTTSATPDSSVPSYEDNYDGGLQPITNPDVDNLIGDYEDPFGEEYDYDSTTMPSVITSTGISGTIDTTVNNTVVDGSDINDLENDLDYDDLDFDDDDLDLDGDDDDDLDLDKDDDDNDDLDLDIDDEDNDLGNLDENDDLKELDSDNNDDDLVGLNDDDDDGDLEGLDDDDDDIEDLGEDDDDDLEGDDDDLEDLGDDDDNDDDDDDSKSDDDEIEDLGEEDDDDDSKGLGNDDDDEDLDGNNEDELLEEEATRTSNGTSVKEGNDDTDDLGDDLDDGNENISTGTKPAGAESQDETDAKLDGGGKKSTEVNQSKGADTEDFYDLDSSDNSVSKSTSDEDNDKITEAENILSTESGNFDSTAYQSSAPPAASSRMKRSSLEEVLDEEFRKYLKKKKQQRRVKTALNAVGRVLRISRRQRKRRREKWTKLASAFLRALGRGYRNEIPMKVPSSQLIRHQQIPDQNKYFRNQGIRGPPGHLSNEIPVEFVQFRDWYRGSKSRPMETTRQRPTYTRPDDYLQSLSNYLPYKDTSMSRPTFDRYGGFKYNNNPVSDDDFLSNRLRNLATSNSYRPMGFSRDMGRDDYHVWNKPADYDQRLYENAMFPSRHLGFQPSKYQRHHETPYEPDYNHKDHVPNTKAFPMYYDAESQYPTYPHKQAGSQQTFFDHMPQSDNVPKEPWTNANPKFESGDSHNNHHNGETFESSVNHNDVELEEASFESPDYGNNNIGKEDMSAGRARIYKQLGLKPPEHEADYDYQESPNPKWEAYDTPDSVTGNKPREAYEMKNNRVDNYPQLQQPDYTNVLNRLPLTKQDRYNRFLNGEPGYDSEEVDGPNFSNLPGKIEPDVQAPHAQDNVENSATSEDNEGIQNYVSPPLSSLLKLHIDTNTKSDKVPMNDYVLVPKSAVKQNLESESVDRETSAPDQWEVEGQNQFRNNGLTKRDKEYSPVKRTIRGGQVYNVEKIHEKQREDGFLEQLAGLLKDDETLDTPPKSHFPPLSSYKPEKSPSKKIDPRTFYSYRHGEIAEEVTTKNPESPNFKSAESLNSNLKRVLEAAIYRDGTNMGGPEGPSSPMNAKSWEETGSKPRRINRRNNQQDYVSPETNYNGNTAYRDSSSQNTKSITSNVKEKEWHTPYAPTFTTNQKDSSRLFLPVARMPQPRKQFEVGNSKTDDMSSNLRNLPKRDTTQVSKPMFEARGLSIVANSKSVDYDNMGDGGHTFTLTVFAIDKPEYGTPKTGTTMVLVEVIPVNEFTPEWVNPLVNATGWFPSVLVPENVTVGTNIITISATDNDGGEDGRITYSLNAVTAANGKDARELFTIEPSTGILKTAAMLDRDPQTGGISHLDLVITASDNGNPAFSTQASMRLSLADINDNPPVFGKQLYEAVLPTSWAKMSAWKMQLDVTDHDRKAVFKFKVVKGEAQKFLLDENTGTLSLSGTPDRTLPYKVLTIMVSDGGTPELNSTTQVIIHTQKYSFEQVKAAIDAKTKKEGPWVFKMLSGVFGFVLLFLVVVYACKKYGMFSSVVGPNGERVDDDVSVHEGTRSRVINIAPPPDVTNRADNSGIEHIDVPSGRVQTRRGVTSLQSVEESQEGHPQEGITSVRKGHRY